MRICPFLVSVGLSMLAVVARPVSAQLPAAGDLDLLGRVMAKIDVAMTEGEGYTRPVSGLRILAVAANGEGVWLQSDDAGIARAWLQAGSYRLSTPNPAAWMGTTYAWDISVSIQPGMGVITLSQANATTVSAPAPAELQPGAAKLRQPERQRVRVFIDCQTRGCDLDYFRTEIPFVDYMRDRTDASVHVLITSAPTGSGGVSYTINFIGLRDLAGMADTARHEVPQTATVDQSRSGLAGVIKLGLVRYVFRTPDGARLRVSYASVAAGDPASAAAAHDPWNLWVFRTTANGDVGGEESQRNLAFRGSTSANRTSETWKFALGFRGGYNESSYTFSDGSKFTNYSHSFGANHVLVRSVGAHWSIGERASVSSSTFLNEKLFLRFAPTIEFSLFPYAQSTRRRFTVGYAIGVNSFAYEDTTIFGKISEVRPDQSLTATLDFKQPWGSMSVSLAGAALLDDFSKHRAGFSNELDVRLFKGFSLNTYLDVSMLRDQLYLARGELSDEDILLRRRQLASKYNYYGGVGLSYTFGSIFSNVVNTRFNGIR